MNVNDILNKALKLLGIDDVTVIVGSSDARLTRLVNALGVAYMQLITEYAPLEKEEAVTVTGGECALSALSATLFDVVRLRDLSDKTVKCHIRGGKLLTENDGAYRLTYYYLPSSYPAAGGTIVLPERITADLFARGVAAEYALESLLYEEAVTHERKYKEGLLNVLSCHKRLHVEAKRWI